MSAEKLKPFEHIDFSIDQDVVKRAQTLMGNLQVSREVAKEWIESPVKETLERIIFGVAGSIISSPLVFTAAGKVSIRHGGESLYDFEVGFLGKGNERINVTRITKIRSLQKRVNAATEQNPFHTTVFQGGRGRIRPSLERDPRAHSEFGIWLRKTSVDELPQLWTIMRGSMAGVGPRAYTLPELEGLKILFQRHDEGGEVFPEGFPSDYREVVSNASPKPALFGLYTAIHRKELTVSERLMLDHLYLTCANPRGDLRIIKATFETALKGTGAG